MGRKYNCNYNFFDTIDTEEKAYWLGFLYADGHIKKNSHQLTLVLSINDIKHLEKFNNTLNSTYPITIVREKYVKLNISNKIFGETLISKGCVEAKSLILKFPTIEQVPEHMLRHFIRGYFDGDGCLSNRIVKNCMKSSIYILGTYDFLNGVSSSIPVNNIKVHLRNGFKIHDISIYNKMDIIKIFHYLYDNATIYLDRKYQKFLDVIEYVENRFVA